MTDEPPAHLIDWQGRTGRRRSPGRTARTKAAHPNARFTVAATNNPVLDPEWDDPQGVALDAFIFGGRRSTTVPLVTEARNWTERRLHGRHDGQRDHRRGRRPAGRGAARPLRDAALRGYNMADYFQHWLDMGAKLQGQGNPAAHLLRQLVPQGRRRQVRVAGLRRQHARAGVDARPPGRQGRRRRERLRHLAALRRPALGRPGFTREQFAQRHRHRQGRLAAGAQAARRTVPATGVTSCRPNCRRR
jgi:hypothetical protein